MSPAHTILPTCAGDGEVAAGAGLPRLHGLLDAIGGELLRGVVQPLRLARAAAGAAGGAPPPGDHRAGPRPDRARGTD
eukprot:1293470-Pyramimonas_sp.AAC.2